MAEGNAYDAALIRHADVKGATESDRLHWIRDTFGPLLGAARVHARMVAGGDLLLSGDPVAHRYHSEDHPDAGRDRYEWETTSDGWRLGKLKGGSVA